MNRIRVLVVDDSVVFRHIVSDAIASDPDLEVIGTAPNGRIALAKIAQLKPDVVTLDVEMPELDGLQTLVELRKTERSLPVIMFSSRTQSGAAITIDALVRGATDYVTKPTNNENVEGVRKELINKIRAACLKETWGNKSKVPSLRPSSKLRISRSLTARPVVLGIGISTGGPNALAQVFESFTTGLSVPIVVVQHMPPMFTRILAERLSNVSHLLVREGENGVELRPGEAWIAPGGRHMTVVREGEKVVIHLSDDPPENSCKPAVDPLFRSLAKAYGNRVLAVVMTGMGQDGFRGAEVLREQGARVWAQDEASSVVWGMPGAVAKANLAERLVPLAEIGPALLREFGSAEHRQIGRGGL